MEMLIFGGGGWGFHVGVWEQMLVMLILEEGFHEDWRGGSGGWGGGGGRGAGI